MEIVSMRIIAGTARGTKLFSPPDDRIRPTGDRVKESLFNILMNRLQDAVVLDLCCGTGALGLEALSRGAKEAIFVDSSYESLNLAKKNAEKTHFTHLGKWIVAALPNEIHKVPLKKYDLIFADPPYHKLALEILREKDLSKLLTANGWLILEHDETEILPDYEGNLGKFREKKFGKTKVSFYCLQTANKNAEEGTACE
jgi:16S rRNA (guanine966-N2)-methyltransferase